MELDRKAFFNSLRSSPRGFSGGPGGCTYVHLKLLFVLCNRTGLQGKVPEEVREALSRLAVESEALRLAAMHLKRNAHHFKTPCPRELGRAHVQGCHRCQPQFDDSVGETSRDASGTITVAIRADVVWPALLLGERLCAFLDDVYLLCEPSRVKELYVLLADALIRVVGIHLHQGKTRGEHGTEAGFHLITSRTWGPKCGNPRASQCWAHQRIAKERANSSRFAVRMAVPPECKPEGQSHGAHTGGFGGLLSCT